MTIQNGKLPFAAAAVVMALIAGSLHADPIFNANSPQGDVTQGKFESGSDYFMSVGNYAQMDFNKWWGVVSYKQQPGDRDKSNYSSDLAQLGFATRLGGLYVGLSYIGDGWKGFGTPKGGVTPNKYTEQVLTGGKTWKVFPNNPRLNEGVGPGNEASILVGFADMGFKLYYATNFISNKVSDFVVDTGALEYQKYYQEEAGHINPGIAWGMTRPLTSRGIKPKVTVDLDFFRDNQIWEFFAEPGDPYLHPGDPSLSPYETTGMQVQASNNKFTPGISLGLGGFTLVEQNNFSLSADLDYGIKMDLYDNEYSYQDAANKYHTKVLKGGRTHNSTMFADIFEISHALTPSISVGWSGERLGVAGKLSLPMGTYAKNETYKILKKDSMGVAIGDGSLVIDGYNEVTTTYSFNPEFDLAMQWAIIPSRLFLNAGSKTNVLQLTYQTLEITAYTNGVMDTTQLEEGKAKEIKNNAETLTTTLYLGLTFNITKNIEFQAMLGVDSNNVVNVFSNSFSNGIGGFLNFGNLLVSLKF